MSPEHPYWHGREKKYVNMIKGETSPVGHTHPITPLSPSPLAPPNGAATKFTPQVSFPPLTESLQDTIDRTIPLWDSHILPDLRAGRNVMIVAHRNSIRGLIKHIEALNTNG